MTVTIRVWQLWNGNPMQKTPVIIFGRVHECVQRPNNTKPDSIGIYTICTTRPGAKGSDTSIDNLETTEMNGFGAMKKKKKKRN